jgi:hypothetical protein
MNAKHSAILFSDEADALFGKRTEVKDSHDSYADVPIDYILENWSLPGISHIGTNMKNSEDSAFARHI